MATRQGLDASITNRLGADHQEIFFAVKAEFDTSTIAVWSGQGDITISSLEYSGAGSLLGISDVTENSEMQSNGITISLSGMDSTVLNYALSETYQNRPITLLMGYIMGGANESAGELVLFRGRMTSLSIADTPDGATVTIQAENRLADLNRPSHYRYTKESQNFLYPNDVGLNRIASLQDKEIVWGKKSVVDTRGSQLDTGDAGYCFSLDMLIALRDGSYKLAEDMIVGDRVKSINSNELISCEAEGFMDDKCTDLLSSAFVDYAEVIRADIVSVPNYYLIDGKVKVTGYHPFVVLRDNVWAWVRAVDIKSGDVLVDDNLNPHTITTNEFINEETNVMKLSVDNVHNYFGGVDGLMLGGHNK